MAKERRPKESEKKAEVKIWSAADMERIRSSRILRVGAEATQ